MKIESVEPLLIDRYLFVEVRTDTGLVGVGESGVWGYLAASAEIIRDFAGYLQGQDPLRIEHHWQYLYRYSYFRGSVIMGALSAIDIALWDIAGQHYGAPIHTLLGGPTRERVRAYRHVFGASKEELVAGVIDARDQGFTAVGHLTPFLDEDPDVPYEMTYAEKLADGLRTVQAYREAVGTDVDLCLELHRRLTPAEAVQFGVDVAQYHPFFIEDPVTPDNLDETAYVARKVPVPVATGERLCSPWEFQMLLDRDAVQYVRPDVCMVGGITGTRKIAAMAEAKHVNVVPHNPLSPVSTAACVQIAAAIANFALQELPEGEDAEPKAGIVATEVAHDGYGYLTVPTSPGLGASLRPGAVEAYPYRARSVRTRLHRDGSVVDAGVVAAWRGP